MALVSFLKPHKALLSSFASCISFFKSQQYSHLNIPVVIDDIAIELFAARSRLTK